MKTKFDIGLTLQVVEVPSGDSTIPVTLVRTGNDSWLMKVGQDEAAAVLVREVVVSTGAYRWWHSLASYRKFEGKDGLGNKACDRCIAHFVQRYTSWED